MLELRPHQIEVVEKINQGFLDGHRAQLLYAPTGFGKTEVAIQLMQNIAKQYKRVAMVMDRIVLVNQTSTRLARYQIQHGVMQSDHWRYRPTERIQICSAQTLEKRDTFPDLDYLIIDECFTADTKIATPLGLKNINLVRCGDAVYNQCGIGIVEAVSIKPAIQTYRLEFDDGTITECTGNHPFFTELGWKTAGELEIGAYTFGIQGVRLLWEGLQTLDSFKRNGENSFSNAGAELEYANQLLNILLQEIKEPHEQSSVSPQNESKITRDSAQTYQTWRERAVAAFATIGTTSCLGGELGVGVCGDHKNGAAIRLSKLLQAGLSKSFSDDGNRNRWPVSHDTCAQGTGSQEDGVSYFPRLVNISHIERASAVSVYNLQISGHPSYFADGKLVHNCHVQRRSVVKFIEENPELRVIGLTATPFTAGLGDVYSHVVGASSTESLIDNGWLMPMKIFISKEIDMTGVTKVAGEWSQDQVTERGMKITGDIVTEWIKKTNEIFGGPKKTVVFCAGVAHGRDLEQQFAKQGYNFKSISYLEDDDYKREIIEDFGKPDTSIHGLIATDILTRGFDVPDVLIGVSARPFSKSFSSHVQQMGRIMRPAPNKTFGVWLDHSGNYLRFRNDWDKLFTEGVTELENGDGEKAKKEPTEKEKKDSKCPACGGLWVAGELNCVHCGHTRPIRGIASVPGELQELFPSQNSTAVANKTFYSELLYYSRMRGYKDGWAAHKYKEKFGTFPPRGDPTPIPVTQKTVNWIRSRQIAWAKSQQKA